MTRLSSFESTRKTATGVLCLVAIGLASAFSHADAADSGAVFQAPRLVSGRVFTPPPAPPSLFIVQTAPTVQPEPKPAPKPAPKPEVKPAPVPVPAPAPAPAPAPKTIPAPTVKPLPKTAPPAPGWVPRAGSAAGTDRVRLYRCVKYKGLKKVPKDSIPLVIQVPDPRTMPSWFDSLGLGSIRGCAVPRDCPYPRGFAVPRGCPYPRGFAAARPVVRRMVSVKICAPASGIECMRVGRHVWSSRKFRYDFGEFQVDIR
ncbi:MAG: hypothetical protein VB861_07265, partial [Planctomycetaceae bacterium]